VLNINWEQPGRAALRANHRPSSVATGWICIAC